MKRLVVYGLALILVAYSAGFAFGADNDQPASDSFREAGHDVTQAAKNAYKGTKQALSDTTITAEVKEALFSNKLTKDQDIHVKTVQGVVSLTGAVTSADISTEAEHISAGLNGVQRVDNKLTATQAPLSAANQAASSPKAPAHASNPPGVAAESPPVAANQAPVAIDQQGQAAEQGSANEHPPVPASNQ